MPSSLGNNLLDSLIGSVVDPLRASLYPLLGNKQFTVHIMRRRWSGAARGSGTATIVSDLVLSPVPTLSKRKDQEFDLREHGGHDLGPAGREEEGEILATEVSLQYTETDLVGDPIAPNEEFFWKVIDGQGQSIQSRFYVVAGPPIPDREKTIGWKVHLRRVQVDGV